ncbi:lipase family protein [Sorangium sp. So ce134]
MYNAKIAEILAFASTWTYADLPTFAERMHRRGFGNSECVSIGIRNEALLLDVRSVLVQSPDRKIAVLCLRGTGPTNALNWLTNVNAPKEPFYSRGYVHGGFHRTVRALRSVLAELLNFAANGNSISQAAKEIEKRLTTHADDDSGCTHDPRRRADELRGHADEPRRPSKLEALYITGHSLGGGLAVLAAALIQDDEAFKDVRDKLRGIYTFGQPMVGDSTFDQAHRDVFNKILFRHVYRRDIVPRLPPLSMGKFAHNGVQYNSTNAGWMPVSKPANRVYTVGLSNLLGGIAWVAQQVFPFGWTPFPVSWGDHLPLNYLRTSMALSPGGEVE